MALWGARSERRLFSDAHWREPLRWNAEAVSRGERRRVFCASMGDVFEPRAELDPWRDKLWSLIESTRELDWLLLTKRPDRVHAVIPWNRRWPSNVWLGTTAENQLWANRRVPVLIEHGAAVRFVSCEPLLGSVDLSPWLHGGRRRRPGLDWVIVGGESGHRARPMHPEWAKAIRDQCTAANTAFHFKQWGQWRPDSELIPCGRRRIEMHDARRRSVTLVRLGKHATGRDLDGRTWDEFPR
jgi:protein gp37